MLREYQWNGSTWQFEEADAPSNAVVCNKCVKPENKEVKPKTKTPPKAKKTTEVKEDVK